MRPVYATLKELAEARVDTLGELNTQFAVGNLAAAGALAAEAFFAFEASQVRGVERVSRAALTVAAARAMRAAY